MTYELGRVPRILTGAEQILHLPEMLKAWERSSVVLIVDAMITQNGFTQKMREVLKAFPVAECVVPAGEPTIASVNEAALLARSYPRPLIVGIGGGSALDTAKQTAAISSSFEGVEHYLLCANPLPKRRRLIAIPTTAGTGAEVTRSCIVSDASGRKLWTWGDEMLPDVVILDAHLTTSLPAHLTASTGLDAFTHALEAHTAQRKNAVSSANALQAMRLVRKHLASAVRDGQDLQARQAMQEAALLAGLAIDNCGTGIAHCIGHALGTLHHIPHGVAVTVALEASLEWAIAAPNMDAKEAYKEAAEVFHVKAQGLPNAFKKLLDDTRFADAVRALKPVTLEAEAIAQTMTAIENQPMLSNNARIANETDRLELAKSTVRIWNAYHR